VNWCKKAREQSDSPQLYVIAFRGQQAPLLDICFKKKFHLNSQDDITKKVYSTVCGGKELEVTQLQNKKEYCTTVKSNNYTYQSNMHHAK